MTNYLAPDVYIEEIASGSRSIQGVGTSTVGFVGNAPDKSAYVNEPRPVHNWAEFQRLYVGKSTESTPLAQAVYGFFLNGGGRCFIVNLGAGTAVTGSSAGRAGLDLLESIDEIAVIAIPGFTDAASYDAALSFCEGRKDCVAILDGPSTVPNNDVSKLTEVATATAKPNRASSRAATETADDASAGTTSAPAGFRARLSEDGYGAYYWPWVLMRDPLTGATVPVPPSGMVAGVYARTDASRGVHKPPANAVMRGALGTTYTPSRSELALLNSKSVNVIRAFSDGILVWGARTLADPASPYRYVNVRRLQCFISESIQESMRWVVFEPNSIETWKSISRDITAFLMRIWRSGGLMGETPQQAFFVKCDAETNPQENIDAGIVTTQIGIAPVKPAEFVVFQISQFSDDGAEPSEEA
jgi:hypothetical protein